MRYNKKAPDNLNQQVKEKIRKAIIFLFSVAFVFSFLFTEKSFAKKTAHNGLVDSTDCEVRGVWIDEISSSEQAATIVNNIRAANLNTVFVVSPPIGPNDGWSSKKQFSNFVRLAYQRGLNVQIWVPNMYRQKNGVQSDFRNKKERKAQKKWVLNLLKKYKRYVRGIHFDYIRYHDWENVNTGQKMDAVNQIVREMTSAVRKKYKNMFVTSTTVSATPTWADFSTEGIPQWFRNWYDAHPGNVYATSYSFPTVPNHMKYQQDPVGWIRESNLDAVMPMQYTTSDTDWNQEADSWKSFLSYVGKEPSRILMGIGWLEEEGHPEWGYDAAGVAQKIAYGRSLGYKGFVIYELNGGAHDQKLVNVLMIDSSENGFDAPFENPAATCFQQQN
ncbi:MAG: hypothetical protein A3J76_04415 [Candidatus Moranbacteria bacterium RBG_13_45_13]|nr:MAG: hypothetical protein A3J76_04415 [Candidatus Moranbacteria bacterium RBG_13_45_13]